MKFKYSSLLAYMYMAKIKCKNFNLKSVEIGITKEEVSHIIDLLEKEKNVEIEIGKEEI